MSEIEKMYENIGVKADRIVCYRGFDNCMDNDFNCHCHNEKPCKDAAKIYPPFTAEKQIELIKWLIQKYKTILIEHKLNLFYINIRDIYTGKVHIEFDETIAGLINNIWQYLTEEEKASIKNILEM